VATHKLDMPDVEVRVIEADPLWVPTSVFGTTLTARHQLEAFETVKAWGYWAQCRDEREVARLDRLMDRDAQLVRAARRWGGRPLTPPVSGRFVPGDVAAMRHAVLTDELARRAQGRMERIAAGEKIGMLEERAVGLDSCARVWLHEATPYFVDLATLVGLVDCEIPTGDDLDELRLPGRSVAIYFGGDVAVPMALIEADRSLELLAVRHDSGNLQHPDWSSADDRPATTVANPTIAIGRDRPVRVSGVVLHGDDDGRLDDLVMWLTAVPDHVDAPRSLIYGWLSRSMLRHVAVNLAAAAAWGQWTAPTLGAGLDDTIDTPQFRKAVRTSRFRRHEPAGGAVGVRVLDARRTMQPSAGTAGEGGTHASPVTHRRRRHWRRQRVGPRDDWRYERRLIAPTIVNPGHQPVDNPLTVYRLPPPPDTPGSAARRD
jgi:hypothetical protein